MRIGIDAMGSDQAPVAEVKGALEARSLLSDGDKIVLVGVESAIRQHLEGVSGWEDTIEIHHTDQYIRMDDKPVESLRTKPNSSLALMTRLQAEGKVDACISAGNTGAFVAASMMGLRRLPGVQRPGIAIIAPTFHGPVVLCDVGANVNCRAQHLHQYGVMASIYSRTICKIESPRVALMSVGEEAAKGNDLVKKTRELLEAEPSVNFVGNAEGRDIFRGTVDVVICEGFVGNVVLKLMEGMAEETIKAIVSEAVSAFPQMAAMVGQAVKSMKTKWDFNEYGGAPLLGVDGICIICHGASNYRGIMNAVRVAKSFSTCQVNQQISQILKSSEGTENV